MTRQRAHYKIKRVKIKKGKAITIEYFDGSEHYTLESTDKPLNSFFLAFSELAGFIGEILELPASAHKRLEPRGVHLDYKDDVMGVVFTTIYKLQYTTAPAVINTPHKPERAYGKGGDQSNNLSAPCVKAVKRVIEEAVKYLDGERAQGSLFDDKKKSNQKKYVEERTDEEED